jgi:catechol-2,3-dioxygenase
MIHLKSMNGVALKVRDLERSKDWYSRHFGFAYNHSAEGCIIMTVGDIDLVLSPHDNPDAPLADCREVRCIHTLAFEIPESEFHKVHAEFQKEDDDIVDFDQDEFQSIITSDPDGYCVELYYRKQGGKASGPGAVPIRRRARRR